MKKFSAFTLAEVLITLGIIGVVAAMTMPTLINQTNGAQYRAAFKKELSVIAQAVTLNVALEDFDFADLSGTSGSGNGTLSEMLQNRTNVVRKASLDDIKGEGYSPLSAADSERQLDTGDTIKISDVDEVSLFNDGSMFMYKKDAAGCTEDAPCYGWFDVNGMKGPNKETKCDKEPTSDKCSVKIPTDIFPVKFYDQSILPASNAGRAVLYDNGNTATRADGSTSGTSSSTSGSGGS